MELENEMNSMDYLNLESNEIAITVIDTQGNRKYFTLNKLSKVKELCQLYLKETNQIGKRRLLLICKESLLIMIERLRSKTLRVIHFCIRP